MLNDSVANKNKEKINRSVT